ncbi:MAG: response regulator transcription factor [Anaerolineales bacterium]|nr:response regulator transcription factor [Anaerolineales bacterium]
MMIRILLVDDCEGIRRTLSMILSIESDIDVIGFAADGVEALVQTKYLQPDVVIMDVAMPQMDGITATRLLRESYGGSEVIIYSYHDDIETQKLALDAGAIAFVSKRNGTGILTSTIRQAMYALMLANCRELSSGVILRMGDRNYRDCEQMLRMRAYVSFPKKKYEKNQTFDG